MKPTPVVLYIGNDRIVRETLPRGDEILVVNPDGSTGMTLRWNGPTLEVRCRGDKTGWPTS